MSTLTAPAASDAATLRLSAWLEIQSEKARLHAREAALLNEVFSEALDEREGRVGTDDMRDIPVRSLVAEFSAAGRVSSRTMEKAMWDAFTLVSNFPVTFQALEAAKLSPTHARVIVDAGVVIEDQADRFAYELAAVDYASGESPNRLRSVTRMLSAKHGGITAADRRKKAHDDRRVWIDDYEDGSSVLHVMTSSVLAHAALDRANQLARLARDPESGEARPIMGEVENEYRGGEDETLIAEEDVQASPADADAGLGISAPNDDPRTMAQARADVMIDMLLAACPETVSAAGAEAIRPHIQVTLPAAVLAGASDAPADLFGCGPVDPELVRELAGLAPGWDRLYVDECSGMVTATDRYRPTAEMRRYLRARDGRCRFPGCAASTWNCDLDHTEEHSRGGATSCANLSHLCRRHHSLKHPDLDAQYRWNARQLPGGKIEWTSPRGAVFVDHPQPRVHFV
ncbi:HNH endonuclease signature motif containing protein [Microbacterium sp.]|uniref:HNH endonuclease signature motif containing protein n=1 Tax=Microbacterium sp. TaxID=51671 RepID=UPI002601E79D|nr:HNH endonuclease signature motif containing protein [Microbacterium sp.]